MSDWYEAVKRQLGVPSVPRLPLTQPRLRPWYPWYAPHAGSGYPLYRHLLTGPAPLRESSITRPWLRPPYYPPLWSPTLLSRSLWPTPPSWPIYSLRRPDQPWSWSPRWTTRVRLPALPFSPLLLYFFRGEGSEEQSAKTSVDQIVRTETTTTGTTTTIQPL